MREHGTDFCFALVFFFVFWPAGLLRAFNKLTQNHFPNTSPFYLSRTFCSLKTLETVLLQAQSAGYLHTILKKINEEPDSKHLKPSKSLDTAAAPKVLISELRWGIDQLGYCTRHELRARHTK